MHTILQHYTKKDVKSIDITNPWGMTYVSNLQGTLIIRKKAINKTLTIYHMSKI